MKVLKTLVPLAMTLASTGASAADATNATALYSGITRAKSVIDRAISSSGRPSGGGVSQPGSGGNPWGMSLDGFQENDATALPILIQASTSLGLAAQFADQSKIAFLGGNIQFGNFRFATACSNMGISRSQIARANTAALQPPAGFLAAFGPDLAAVVIELNQLRVSQGCP